MQKRAFPVLFIGHICSCNIGWADDLVQEQAEPENYALTVFTAQERKEWEPVIKEFEERTGWNVRVETGSAKEMLSQLEKEEADWDVAFGVSADALEEGKEYWQTGKDAWTGYSAVSFVICGIAFLLSLKNFKEKD